MNTGEAFTYEIDPSESVSNAVVRAVASVSNSTTASSTTASERAGPQRLDPLYTVIDPDALDALFRSTSAEDSRRGRVTFYYADCEVTVYGRERVEVRSRSK